MNLFGLDIVINPLCDDLPRMTVSRRFAELMPADFVADLNAWMLEFFGTENRMYVLQERTLVVGPKGFEQIKTAGGGL
ncbi:hypothetical protein QZM93_38585 [Burkholderia cepacia]|uniref:hypothetical protein n=1 Tax=Burkholderia cepacia TaxID=292 RepID=UPI0026510B6F|nr:hypothetical protein [Burkholderia cepacia]MDN7894511.1 hypothetical protein [Burkholderia cepacia]